MIEALGLVHFWSLIIAGGAWYLQRDNDGAFGSRFPGPGVWGMLIWASLVPGLIYLIPFGEYITLPNMQVFEVEALRPEMGSQTAVWLPSLLTIYLGGAGILMLRTVWQWLQLQRLPLQPTTQAGVYSTTETLPPLTLSWPKRAIVIPDGIQPVPALIRHERAHLQHNDGELTLLLLLLHDALLRNPGIGYLIKQWRLAIELRADQAAIRLLSEPERKDYARLLLDGHRPACGDELSLPCPTARLGNPHHRDVKLRLTQIVANRPPRLGRNWRPPLLCAFVSAGILGLASAATSAETGIGDRRSAIVDYVTQTSPVLPTRCPDLGIGQFMLEKAFITVNGQRVPGYKVRLGTVILRHDVRRNGTVHNPRILDSTNRCFEAEAANALVQWKAEPQPRSLQGVVMKMHFGISGEDPDELKEQIANLNR